MRRAPANANRPLRAIMFPKALLSTLLLALVVAANPVPSLVKLPLTRRFNSDNAAAFNIVKRDQARARSLVTRASVPVTNNAVHYIAAVEIGSPPTTYDLVVDTASGNTWIGADKSYVQTSSSHQTPDKVEYTDTVTLGSGLVIEGQSIGVASTSSGFTGLDGVLGIGPADLSKGTLSPDSSTTIPTVTDNLFAKGLINADMVSISFEPATSQSDQNGELAWGDTDSSKFTGSVTYVPITSASPANTYWGIDQAITYGSSGTPILSTTAGIVDTATTMILIASDAFTKYQQATGATMDSTTSMLTLSSSQFANLESLFFHIGDTAFELTANAQIWPRALNTAIGGTAGNIYLIVGDNRSNSGAGLDFVNGYTFLERFYTVYDTANHRVGFATTPFTTATSN
ncbi:aspartic peptidase A1 [Amanita rubescens]|nr:aspartic peptidase A1 [Amanita rubescens]